MFKPKTSATEYDPSMLPKNRKELFFDVLKLNFGKMLMFGCLMLLFSFPIHALAIAEDFYRGALNQTVAGVTEVEKLAAVYQSQLMFNVLRHAIDIPLLALFSVGLAGMSRVIRQYAWGENVDFNHDFSLGVRQNGKQYALIALLTGAIIFVLNACLKFNDFCILLRLQGIGAIEPKEAYDWLSVIPAALCAMFLIPIAGCALVAACCYENKLRDNLKIGRVCYFKSLFKTLLACVCCLTPFAVQMLPFFWCHLAGRILSSAAIPVVMLGWTLFSLGSLDEVVNKKLHPDLVGKGLYWPQDPQAGEA